MDTNRISGRRIAANIDVLKREAGLTDGDIARVPMLYTARTIDYLIAKTAITGMEPGPARDKAIAELDAMRKAGAETPNPVNGLVLAGGEYVAPRPYGPVVGGKDVFMTSTTKAFALTGHHVTYINDLVTHFSEGEIHCATNILRDVFSSDSRWWQHG
ncbi:hypothetical protein Cci01nite_82360 [Catellatospora citrea]|uniref:Protein-arginine deiminase C-terminal domain-containing protein n=1 Tax=Catellatospora citrea TaxID=53366 RepID=A0A8J3KHQ1_9ACTN|nr:hypothetical protein Cci01nite_82360 [Catellatospora citrea]